MRKFKIKIERRYFSGDREFIQMDCEVNRQIKVGESAITLTYVDEIIEVKEKHK